MSPAMFIGIDNGLSGGLVALSATPGAGIIAMRTMPVCSDIREIDAAAVVDWMRDTMDVHQAVVAIEDCPEHAQKKSTMRSMAISYGILKGAIIAGCRRARLVTVRSGNPRDSWQRAMLGGLLPKGETKAAALDAASRLWPDERWILPGRRTPDTGLIDAALIAEFIRRKFSKL